MEIIIREGLKEDAETIIEITKVVGGETDNLTFGEEGVPISVEEEKAFLVSMADSNKDIFLVALVDDELVGTAIYTTFPRKRMSHRGEVSVSLRKSAWGMGIGSRLMEKLLDFARDTAKVEIVSLEVRSDNVRAINLYRKFGFEKVGCFKGAFKIKGELFDVDTMEKFL